MVTMSLTHEGHGLTKADVDLWPDDGYRYELVDGALIVTPSPSLRHQAAAGETFRRLANAAPRHLLVLSAPTDVTLAPDTTLQPDVFVVDRGASLPEGADLRPLLAVEVLSPSTRHIDLTLKRARYEAAGTPQYWVVDHEVPSITAWTLTDGRYGDPVVVTGSEVLCTEEPFAVEISPADLTLP